MARADRYPPGPFIASGDKACFFIRVRYTVARDRSYRRNRQ